MRVRILILFCNPLKDYYIWHFNTAETAVCWTLLFMKDDMASQLRLICMLIDSVEFTNLLRQEFADLLT